MGKGGAESYRSSFGCSMVQDKGVGEMKEGGCVGQNSQQINFCLGSSAQSPFLILSTRFTEHQHPTQPLIHQETIICNMLRFSTSN